MANTKIWVNLSESGDQQVADLSEQFKVNPIFARMMFNRGIMTQEQAEAFFSPDWSDLHDPFLFSQMAKAVERIEAANSANEKVWVYGDYDVDGTTSVALVFGFLRQIIGDIEFYIPDREKEGYGISSLAIQRAIDEEVKLIIALDCGIRSVDLTAVAKNGGVDLIICDHHEPGQQIPDAYAILNPKCPGETYPFKELSGCGIGFKLIQALCDSWGYPDEEYQSYIDLVAVSIASDLVPKVN